MLWTCVLAFLQAESAEKFLDFKKGTSWIYDEVRDGAKIKIVNTVERRQENRVFVSVQEERAGGKIDQGIVAWYAENGFLLLGLESEEGILPLFRFYRLDSKKDDAWDAAPHDPGLESQAVHFGTEELTVPAGTFHDVIHIQIQTQIKGGEAGTMDLWFTPGFGLLKSDVEAGEHRAVKELREFTPAKE